MQVSGRLGVQGAYNLTLITWFEFQLRRKGLGVRVKLQVPTYRCVPMESLFH